MPRQRGRQPLERDVVSTSREAPRTGRHRDDIQGLRAVAVLLVVLSHAGVGFLRGGFIGVDVFFVLSGFLITGLLLADVGKPRRQAIAEFYSRRARRILPAAALTLVATDVVAYRLLNVVRAKQAMQDSGAAAFFTANLHFSNQGTDYSAASQPPSPIQHFWSLAVEEQFYLVWPLILSLVVVGLALTRASRRRRGHQEVTAQAVRRLLVVVLAIGLLSLAWCVHETGAHPTAAYFSTLARAWELALGAGIAVGAGHLSRISAGGRTALGWAGLVMIAIAGVAFSSSTRFPGTAAILPTLGAALVIAAGLGQSRTRFDVGRLLAVRPMRYVGDRSYSLYLWHWPVLIIAVEHAGHELSVGTRLALMLGAFALSMASFAFFEDPIRRMRWPSPARALVLWPVSVLLVLIVAGWGIGKINDRVTADAVAAAPRYPGLPVSESGPAKARSAGRSSTPAAARGTPAAVLAAARAAQRGARLPSPLTPAVTGLLNDNYAMPSGCAPKQDETTSAVCSFGNTSATRSIVLIGDSHAQMWMPAILRLADQDGWAVRPVTKSGCAPVHWFVAELRIARCSAWLAWAVRQVASLRPAAVLVAGDFGDVSGRYGPEVGDGLRALSTSLRRSAKHVVFITDQAPQTEQPVDCLLRPGADMARCSLRPTLDQAQAAVAIQAGAAAGGAGTIDATRWLCANGVCPMVIGHDIVYTDTNHLSSTYVLRLAGVFRAAFRDAIAVPRKQARSRPRTRPIG
jgi:peptidoglycan/LPS O-acetylase OafA/YrhL